MIAPKFQNPSWLSQSPHVPQPSLLPALHFSVCTQHTWTGALPLQPPRFVCALPPPLSWERPPIHLSSWGSTSEYQLPPTTPLTPIVGTSGPGPGPQLCVLRVGSTPYIVLWFLALSGAPDPSGPHLSSFTSITQISCFFQTRHMPGFALFPSCSLYLELLHPPPLSNIPPLLCDLCGSSPLCCLLQVPFARIQGHRLTPQAPD